MCVCVLIEIEESKLLNLGGERLCVCVFVVLFFQLFKFLNSQNLKLGRMLILFLKPNATFKYFLLFGLIVLFGATLIDPNSSPCGVSGIDNGNTGHFYVTFVECVS